MITLKPRGQWRFASREDLAGFVDEAREKVDREVKLPTGYTVAWGGTFKNLQEASARLAVAVPVARVMIFVRLHSTFKSTRLAALIFLNVPMAATGGVFALWLRGLPFSISAGGGFIAPFGVAVLNGVVLVTYIVDLRKAGLRPADAAFEGAMTRRRPVPMTGPGGDPRVHPDGGVGRERGGELKPTAAQGSDIAEAEARLAGHERGW